MTDEKQKKLLRELNPEAAIVSDSFAITQEIKDLIDSHQSKRLSFRTQSYAEDPVGNTRGKLLITIGELVVFLKAGASSDAQENCRKAIKADVERLFTDIGGTQAQAAQVYESILSGVTDLVEILKDSWKKDIPASMNEQQVIDLVKEYAIVVEGIADPTQCDIERRCEILNLRRLAKAIEKEKLFRDNPVPLSEVTTEFNTAAQYIVKEMKELGTNERVVKLVEAAAQSPSEKSAEDIAYKVSRVYEGDLENVEEPTRAAMKQLEISAVRTMLDLAKEFKYATPDGVDTGQGHTAQSLGGNEQTSGRAAAGE